MAKIDSEIRLCQRKYGSLVIGLAVVIIWLVQVGWQVQCYRSERDDWRLDGLG